MKTHTKHNCDRHHREPHALMRCAMPHAWVYGYGQYAVITRCRHASVALSHHQREAEQRLDEMNVYGCGMGCGGRRQHELLVVVVNGVNE